MLWLCVRNEMAKPIQYCKVKKQTKKKKWNGLKGETEEEWR